jgi:ribosome-binding factor A
MSRIDRINSLLRTEISKILQEKINDSRIGFISIVDVNTSKDLRHAVVFYSQLGSESERQKTKRGLYSAQKFIKSELGKVLHMKSIPDIHFKYDESIERGSKAIDILNSL